MKGLIFCSRVEEARELSRKFNEHGWRTMALSGADSEEERARAIERLTMDVQSEDDDYLDYLITVDIFSEGTDIVEVNQVIMLRPTQSPVVFIQQLGRGLRKAEGKEYVVILDFIGNYKNNFMIPIVLSGDRSYNKDNIRRYLREGGRVIPGASTIHFDEISRKKIYESIDGLFLAEIESGNLVLKEHEAARWLTREELDAVDTRVGTSTLQDDVRPLISGGAYQGEEGKMRSHTTIKVVNPISQTKIAAIYAGDYYRDSEQDKVDIELDSKCQRIRVLQTILPV